MMPRTSVLLLFGALLLCATPSTSQSWFDDVTVESAVMRISKAELDGQEKTPTIYRDFLHAYVGKGRSTFGLLYQYTTRGGDFGGGDSESGLMLTGSYDHILRDNVRLELFGRLGLTSTDVYQPLFGTDTDVRANLVFYDADGHGYFRGHSFFSSAYVGTVVNSWGRVQGLAGFGSWWKRYGLYLTGFHAFNGDDARGERINFAELDNAGISFTALGRFGRFEVEVKRNFIIRNGGNDVTATVRYRMPNRGGQR